MLSPRSIAFLFALVFALVFASAGASAGGDTALDPATSVHAGPAGASPPYDDVVFADAPSAYWRLGEPRGATTAADSSGNGISATYQNVTLAEPGALYDDSNKAARFSGSNGLNAGDQFDFVGRQAFTLEAWINPRIVENNAWHMVFEKELWDSKGRQGYTFSVNRNPTSGDIEFGAERYRDGAADTVYYAVADGEFRLRRWHHVALTYDGSVLSLYLDGVKVDEKTGAVRELNDTAAVLTVGKTSWGGGFPGKLDEVAVYGRGLAPAEIRSHYTANPMYASALIDDAPSGYWRLGEKGGATTARDSSGNANHGNYSSVALEELGAIDHDPDTAAWFGGSGASVEVGDKLDFPVRAPYTLEAWAFPADLDDKYSMVLQKEAADASGRQGYVLWMRTSPDGTVVFAAERFRDGASDLVQYAVPETAFRFNRWYHVAVTYDGSTMRLYVEGDEVATQGSTRELKDTPFVLRIGKTSWDQQGFPGMLDEVAIFPRALNAREIRNHYAGNAPASYRRTVEKDRPRAWWRLGDPASPTSPFSPTSLVSAYDAGGYELDGDYGPNVQRGVAGALRADSDTAALFTGTDDVNIGDDELLDFGTDDFTVEAWLKTTLNGERTVMAKHDGTNPNWRLTVTDDAGYIGRVRAVLHDGTTAVTAYGPSTRVDDGEWHHVAAVFDRGSSITIYVDRVGRITPATAAGSVSNAAPFRIGDTVDYDPFDGTLDEVAVYGHGLPAERVRAHYDAAVGLPAPYKLEVRVASANAAWRLGEGDGSATPTTAFDETNGGMDGTYGSEVTAGVAGALMDDLESAAHFHGNGDEVGDDVRVPHHEFLDVGIRDFAVETWVRTNVNGERAVIAKGEGTVEPNWHVTVTDDSGYVGRARAKIFDGTTTLYAYGPPIRIDDDEWHHVVFAFDRDVGIYAYVDGVEEFTPGAVTGDILNSTDLRIGDTTNHDPFLGDIDEVALYNSLPTPAQLAAHHHAGTVVRLGAAHFRGDAISTPGLVRTVDGEYEWQITNRLGGSPAHIFRWQNTGIPVVGDWDGDGVDSPGVVINGNHWILSNGYGGTPEYDFTFGNAGDEPVVGDWNADGQDTPGIHRGALWLLSNDFVGTVHHSITFGLVGDKPLAGDWNADSRDTPGIKRGSFWALSNDLIGTVNHTVLFGFSSDQGVVGDWNDDGADTLGTRRNASEWRLSDDLLGTTDYFFRYSSPGDTAVVGDWDPEPLDVWDGWEDQNGEELGPQAFRLESASSEASALTSAPVDGYSVGIPAVVQRYAPRVYVHPSDDHRPARPLTRFIERSELRWTNPGIGNDNLIKGRGDVRAKKLGLGVPILRNYFKKTSDNSEHVDVRFVATDCTRRSDPCTPRYGRSAERNRRARLDEDRGFFLDPSNGDGTRAGEQDLRRAPVFYDWRPRYITYWFFYAYNDSVNPFNHEGDWERIVVKLNRLNVATQVAFYYHNCTPPDIRDYPKDVELVPNTDHPVVFSAEGSHASYWSDNDPNNCTPHNDNTERDENHRWNTWTSLHDVWRQPWFGFGGAWGELGDIGGDSDGPLGPSIHKAPAPAGW